MDERLLRIKDLIETKQRVDTELEELIGGSVEKKKRSPQKCSTCDQEGHTARNCPGEMAVVTI